MTRIYLFLISMVVVGCTKEREVRDPRFGTKTVVSPSVLPIPDEFRRSSAGKIKVRISGQGIETACEGMYFVPADSTLRNLLERANSAKSPIRIHSNAVSVKTERGAETILQWTSLKKIPGIEDFVLRDGDRIVIWTAER